MADTPAISLRNVTKDYQSLRPLRIREFDLATGQSCAILGLDAAMAEVLVSLLTGGLVPDSGEVLVMGRPTSSVADRVAWLALLDQFGLVSERSVLLEQLTAEQNLAMPFSLAVHSMTGELRESVDRLADEIGLDRSHLPMPIAHLPALSRVRLRLGRALALNPRVVLAEHPTATLNASDGAAFAADLARVGRVRGHATLVLTADRKFAFASAARVLSLQPGTGELKQAGRWWG